MKISQIIEGWRNRIIPPKELEALIETVYEERMKICRQCEEFSENKRKSGFDIIRLDEHCTNCGCTLGAKARCLSCECPLKKWLSVTSPEQEQRWKESKK